jgi:hypothetical protein
MPVLSRWKFLREAEILQLELHLVAAYRLSFRRSI